MGEVLHWDDEAAAYVRSRGDRYQGGQSLEPEWAQEALQDRDVAALEPDPKSRMGASRFIGYSPGAGRVVTVIAFRDEDGDLHLINAWPATGADLRIYREEITDGQDDGS
ncbi:Hypothetical protein PROPJV5_2030 [Propionibacterium ruminifibrarum]|uniref:BrnT family toxin n=1 Tax=Propionibacterium ruminifibrarum TaxID=1962131 RepID=A0A375I4I4_9ACTN|nr:hypothetical protein [Propionibacterium ruminifibrarum]SPF69064.1 Hypothetical protein PROPJV5_2030 [Propionibacterium ruminifibrarum]